MPRVCRAFPGLVLLTARGGRCCYSPHFTAGKLRAEEVGVPGAPGGHWRCGEPAAPAPPTAPRPPGPCGASPGREPPGRPRLPKAMAWGPASSARGGRLHPASSPHAARARPAPRGAPAPWDAQLHGSAPPGAPWPRSAASRHAWRSLPCLSGVGSGGCGSGP